MKRFPCFDGLRAIAAGGVLLVHASLISGFNFRHEHGAGAYFARAESGVALFFLISGFLLYRPWVAARFDGGSGPTIRVYARNRFLRIVPAYWVALTILVVILDARHRNDIHNVGDIVIYYGFLQIYFHSHVVGGIQQAWSLCTEVTFYMFLPLWAALQVRLGRRADSSTMLRNELVGLAALYAIGLGSRLLIVRGLPSGTIAVDGRLDWLVTNLDLFALGMVLAVGREWAVRRETPPQVLEIVGRLPGVCWLLAGVSYWAVCRRVGLPVGVGADTPGQWMGRQLLYGSTAFFLILPAVFGPQEKGLVRRLLQSRVLVVFGLISYGVYLWHEAMLDGWMRAHNIPPFLGSFPTLLAVSAVGSVVAATVSYLLVERPALARKDRRPAPARAAAGQTA